MDNRTRCVEYVDKREFDLLKQEVQALRQKMENINKPYGFLGESMSSVDNRYE